MKSGKRGNLFLFFAIVILASSPFVFAGLGDWWAKFTGKASTDTTAVAVTVSSSAPVVYQVLAVSGQTPFESDGYRYFIEFNVSDVDGAATINTSSARIELDGNDGVTRFNYSCVKTADLSGGFNQTYNCYVNLTYFDNQGTWTINASIRDNGDLQNENTSRSFTHGLRHAWVAFGAAAEGFNFSTVTPQSVDQGSTNDPYVLNNTGNDANLTINVSAKYLRGATITTEFLPTNNFTVSNITGCNSGQTLNNYTGTAATQTLIVNGELDNGQNTTGYSGSTEELYLCLEGLPSTIVAQDYTSAFYGPWSVDTAT